MIFAHLLGGKFFEITPHTYREISENRTNSKHALAILAVCRQLYAETALQPFRLNTFSAEYPKVLNEWVRTLRPVCVEAITSIHPKFQVDLYLPRVYVSSRISALTISKKLKLSQKLLSSEACTRGQIEVVNRLRSPVTYRLSFRSGLERKKELLMARLRKRNKGVGFIMR